MKTITEERLFISSWCVGTGGQPRIGHCKHCVYYTLKFFDRVLYQYCELTEHREHRESYLPVMKPHCEPYHHLKVVLEHV